MFWLLFGQKLLTGTFLSRELVREKKEKELAKNTCVKVFHLLQPSG